MARIEREERVKEFERAPRSLLTRAGVPERFIAARISDFASLGEDNGLVRYGATLEERAKACTGLVVIGPVGTGKTHLACALVARAFELGLRGRYGTALGYCSAVKASYGRQGQAQQESPRQAWVAPHLLALDEIGFWLGTDADRVILFELLNERYNAMRPTVLFSNLTLAELEDTIGPALIDRARDGGGAVVALDGKSRRA